MMSSPRSVILGLLSGCLIGSVVLLNILVSEIRGLREDVKSARIETERQVAQSRERRVELSPNALVVPLGTYCLGPEPMESLTGLQVHVFN